MNQSTSGVDKSLLLIALHLATGQIGKPGAGPFSLTGQPNAMGGREVGGLATLLPGHRSVENAAHRAEMARHWGVPVERLSPRLGLTAVEMFEALADGRVKALWVAATNPLVSLPDQALVRAGLERAELVVVQDAYFPTETTDYADVVLPAAQWSEKEGTATSSERRVAYLGAAGPPPGRARPDWQIFADLGGPTRLRRRAQLPLRPSRSSTEYRESHHRHGHRHRGALLRAPAPRGADPVAVPGRGDRRDRPSVRRRAVPDARRQGPLPRTERAATPTTPWPMRRSS